MNLTNKSILLRLDSYMMDHECVRLLFNRGAVYNASSEVWRQILPLQSMKDVLNGYNKLPYCVKVSVQNGVTIVDIKKY